MENSRFKFRAWDKKIKKWVNPDAISITLSGIPMAPDETWMEHNLADLVLMQFTGLLDKNGKEIYEGDVCKFDVREGGVGEPEYHNLIGKVGFSFGCYTVGDFSSHYYNLEVIGNIYENGEYDNKSS